MRRYLLIILVIFLAVITYGTAFFIKKERSFDENVRLKQENEELKAQIQKLEIGNWKLEIPREGFLTAKVFSTYPFNIKNKLTINAGEKQGIKKLSVAVLEKNILVGQVVEVFENYSIVKTTFDPNWQLPVRIGEEEINGFFQGGGEPKVILIDKDKPLRLGDVVYSASQEFFYELKIGELNELRETGAGIFKEAVLKVPFNVNELREVQIIK